MNKILVIMGLTMFFMACDDITGNEDSNNKLSSSSESTNSSSSVVIDDPTNCLDANEGVDSGVSNDLLLPAVEPYTDPYPCINAKDNKLLTTDITPVEGSDVCIDVDGNEYTIGTSYLAPDGCNTAVIGENCMVAQTEMACIPDSVIVDPTDPTDPINPNDSTIKVEREQIASTELTKVEGTNTCSDDQGNIYDIGTTYFAPDGCNIANISEDCSVMQTLMACTEPPVIIDSVGIYPDDQPIIMPY